MPVRCNHGRAHRGRRHALGYEGGRETRAPLGRASGRWAGAAAPPPVLQRDSCARPALPTPMPAVWRAVYYANPAQYSMSGLVENEFSSSSWSQPVAPGVTVGEAALEIRCVAQLLLLSRCGCPCAPPVLRCSAVPSPTHPPTCSQAQRLPHLLRVRLNRDLCCRRGLRRPQLWLRHLLPVQVWR